MTPGLTEQQANLLTFIEKFAGKNGFSPSFDQMQHAIGLGSKSGVARLLSALEERGHVRRIRNRARAIEVVQRNDLANFSSMDLRRELMRRTGASVTAS